MNRGPANPALLIIADDLTGALDCACEAAARGVDAAVFPEPAALQRALGNAMPPVIAVSTASRDTDAGRALAAMDEVIACLPELAPRQVMKKVDSRLKGQPGVETLALARALGRTQVLAAPAIPDMGRVQRGGMITGAGITEPLDIAVHLQGLDCILPDITTAADFTAALADAGQGVLLLGARGLAAALIAQGWPAQKPRHTAPPAAPALFVVGSRDPITLSQITRLRAGAGVDWWAAPDGQLPDAAWSSDATPPALRLIQMTPGTADSQGIAPALAAKHLAQSVANLLDRQPVNTLLACGGETAQAVLSALMVERIDLSGTLLPGVALGRIAPPGRAPLQLITKSGGFGESETLAELARLIAPRADPKETRPPWQENRNRL